MLRLKSLRIIEGLQREELAEKLGVSYGTIAAWEQGLKKPSLEHIIKACELFGVPVHYLLGYDMDYDTKKYEYIHTISVLMDMVKKEYRKDYKAELWKEILKDLELKKIREIEVERRKTDMLELELLTEKLIELQEINNSE